jgi:phosphate starvation-inducible PhoH-like protein
VEAGENLGFLPGNLEEKINPYLRPLFDALYDMLPPNDARELIERNVIEVAPLAFMRGRTLNNSFIILDEAQNTTVEQMLMFLTRLGFNSRCVVCGDPSQTDLPTRKLSGLVHALATLEKVEGIQFCRFSSKDVVRHSLVERIVNAYQARAESEAEARRSGQELKGGIRCRKYANSGKSLEPPPVREEGLPELPPQEGLPSRGFRRTLQATALSSLALVC